MKKEKRCQSRAQVLGVRCQKPKAHHLDLDVVHQNGLFVWRDQTADQYGNHTHIHATDEPTMAPMSAEDQLRAWWTDLAASEVERTVPKAVEYGSTDLIDIGMMLGRTVRRQVDEEEAAELGVFFYLIGKIARWQSAIERGERPSDDTLFDIGVYVRMAQRIRHSGGWPGTAERVYKQQTYGMEPQ